MKFVLFIGFILLFLQSLHAQNSKRFNFDDAIAKNDIFAKVNVGFSAFQNNKEIISYNSEKLFIPASTIKILYTLTAIDRYGDEFKYKTKIFHTGKILPDGSLEGDLLIYAGGDPTLGSKRFYDNGYVTVFKIIEKGLKNRGINCIDGDIILVIDDKSYPVNGSWSYEDIGNYYGGGYFPFNFNDNEYSLFFHTGNIEKEPTEIVDVFPDIEGLEIHNYVMTGKHGTSDNAYIYGVPYTYFREVKGTLPPGKNSFEIKGSIPNPAETFMFLLSDYFEETNIFFNNLKIKNKVLDKKKFLFSLVSPSLLEIVKECNDYSINLYSEALAHLLCSDKYHPNNYMPSKEFEDIFSQYKFYKSGNQIVDGCGLSAENLISPKSLNSFINLMFKKMGKDKIKDLFPQAGVDGNFKNLFDVNEGIWLKSGSISSVLNYTGIIESKSGDIIFTIMVNNIAQKDRKSIKKELLKLIQILK